MRSGWRRKCHWYQYRFELHGDNGLPVGHSGAMAKTALGRGLGALLGGSSPQAKPPAPAESATAPASTPVADAGERVERVLLTRIRPCPLQPRKDFSQETLR